MISKYILVLNL